LSCKNAGHGLISLIRTERLFIAYGFSRILPAGKDGGSVAGKSQGMNGSLFPSIKLLLRGYDFKLMAPDRSRITNTFTFQAPGGKHDKPEPNIK